VGLALCMLLLNPLLKSSADLFAKQIEYEKTQALISEADRAFELMGRAIRMASYQNIKSPEKPKNINTGKVSKNQSLELQKGTGYQTSDALFIRHELSDGIDFDCIGNALTKERTKNHLAYQGFVVDRQATLPKGTRGNGGSLICQSLDRQGRIQNTTLMNGVDGMFIEELPALSDKAGSAQRLFEVTLRMTDGAHINIALKRSFATRNFL
jgi:hypothetical protein